MHLRGWSGIWNMTIRHAARCWKESQSQKHALTKNEISSTHANLHTNENVNTILLVIKNIRRGAKMHRKLKSGTERFGKGILLHGEENRNRKDFIEKRWHRKLVPCQGRTGRNPLHSRLFVSIRPVFIHSIFVSFKVLLSTEEVKMVLSVSKQICNTIKIKCILFINFFFNLKLNGIDRIRLIQSVLGFF